MTGITSSVQVPLASPSPPAPLPEGEGREAETNDPPPDLDTLLRDIQSLESLVTDWDDEQHVNTVEALRCATDALHKEALTRLIRALRAEPAAMQVLQGAISDDVIYAVFRHLELIKPSLPERLEDALNSVRPYLQSHGGDVELVEITSPKAVTIRLIGACDGCPASGLTLREGVEKAIKEHCPEITDIQKTKGGFSNTSPNGSQTVNFVSPFARSDDVGWIYAARLDEIPEGGLKTASIDEQSVLLSRFEDKVVCYQNACAHMGMPLDGGELRDGILTCPFHAFEYSLESGECLTAPEVQLQTHAVRVKGDRVEVKLL